MRLSLAARRAGESGEPAASLQRSSNVKRERQQTPTEGRSVFEKAQADIAELKIQLAINDGLGQALIEKLKKTYAALEKLEQKRAARESARRAP
jgi:hypothetical protein